MLEYAHNVGTIFPEFNSTSGLFHLSKIKLHNLVLVPQVPNNFLVNHGYEDSVTKRVSFAPSIDDCLKAMSSNLTNTTLYVYAAPIGTKFIKPSTQQVPDVKITNERWVLEEVQIGLVAVIKVLDAKNEPFKYTYGGTKMAELYGWNWKKIG